MRTANFVMYHPLGLHFAIQDLLFDLFFIYNNIYTPAWLEEWSNSNGSSWLLVLVARVRPCWKGVEILGCHFADGFCSSSNQWRFPENSAFRATPQGSTWGVVHWVHVLRCHVPTKVFGYDCPYEKITQNLRLRIQPYACFLLPYLNYLFWLSG